LHKRQPEALSRERSLEIAKEIGQKKTWVVGFTGGEVLMWPYLFDVIRILKQHDVVVYLVTNGLLLEEKANDIIAADIDTIVVSIDSDQSSEHDEIRKVKGLFQSAVNGIEKIKSERVGKKPWLKSTTVVFKSNLDRLGQIISKLESIVDETSIQPIVGNYDDHPHNRSEGRLSKFLLDAEDHRLVEKKLSQFIKAFPSYGAKYFRLIPTYWFNPQHLAETVKCWSPFLRLQIMPDGVIRQCTVRADYGSTGNLNDCSLMDAWNSPEMQRQREEIRNHRNNCTCWTQDTAFNAVLSKSYLANHLPVVKKR
jgi:MoaA/NifB/PqqE/SkfB family radical SAM enzyme